MFKRSITVLLFASSIFLGKSTVQGDENPIAVDAISVKPLRAGAMIPDVSVTNVDGKKVNLQSLHRDRTVVLVFFRGGWCPICTKHTQALIQAYPRIKELGAELVGISPDNVESSKANVEKSTIPFPIYSDSDVSAARAFGLAFRVDDGTIEKYKGYGIDLEKASGLKHHALPIPAIYIVDKSGKIKFANSNPDYRNRLDPAIILEHLAK